MRSRLLSTLYSAFDQNPSAVSAMTLSHPAGVAWSLTNRRLVVSTEGGAALADIDLGTVGTVVNVAAVLATVGVLVSNIRSESATLSAVVLMDGEGRESLLTNVLFGHTSALWGLIEGYATEVQAAEYAVPQALQQAKMHSAQGEWLDFWGTYFAVPRRARQTDEAYLASIVAETLRAKSNKYAIENAVLDITGTQIKIAEPWQRIFRLNVSALSGSHALHDGVNVGYHLIRPLIPSNSDYEAVMAVIEKTRSAGVMVSRPVRVVPAIQVVVLPSVPTVWASRFVKHSFLINKISSGVLGRLVLDGPPPAINHRVATFSIASLSNAQGANNLQAIAPWRNVAKASVALSAGFALGGLNNVLGRGRLNRQVVPSPSLSGLLAMSGARSVITIDRVREITQDARKLLATNVQGGQLSFGYGFCLSYRAQLNDDTGWTGLWGSSRSWQDRSFVGMAITQTSA